MIGWIPFELEVYINRTYYFLGILIVLKYNRS